MVQTIFLASMRLLLLLIAPRASSLTHFSRHKLHSANIHQRRSFHIANLYHPRYQSHLLLPYRLSRHLQCRHCSQDLTPVTTPDTIQQIA